jgi:hypothetical protein
MAIQTTKLGFNTWLPSDYMNVSELNANFNKLDTFVVCTRSQVISTTASNDEHSNTDWLYKEYSDGTAELSAAVKMTTIKCDISSSDNTDAAPYRSSPSTIWLPLTISEVYSLQLTARDAFIMSEDTSNLSMSSISFSLAKFSKDLTNSSYNIYVNIKGRLASS